MKVLRVFALLLVFTVFCAESEKTPPVQEQKQEAQEEQKVIKHATPESTVLDLEKKLTELEVRRQKLEEKEQTLQEKEQELAALQDSLQSQKTQIAERQAKVKKLHRNSWWTLIIGILLILIALVLFIIRPRPPRSAAGETEPQQTPDKDVQSEPESQKSKEPEDEKDPLYEQAVESVLKEQTASVTRLQNELGVGRTRISHILDEMQKDGLVGPSRPNRAREVLKTWDDYQKS